MKPAQISASTSSLAGYRLEDATEAIRRLGFVSVGVLGQVNSRNALGVLPGYSWHYLDANGMNQVRDAVAGFQIVTIRAPFEDLQLASSSPDVRSLSQLIIQKGLQAAPYLRAANVTFNLEPPRFFDAESVWDQLVEAGREMARYAKLFGIKVCVKSSPVLSPDNYVKLLAEIDAPNLGATLDVGAVVQALVGGQPVCDETIRRANDGLTNLIAVLGDRLWHVHLHDVSPDGWRDHRALGTGVLDLDRIIGALEAAGYAGAYELDLEEEDREEALWSSREWLERYLTD